MLGVRFMSSSRRILGIQFFNGDVTEAVELMFRHGGFLVAPSATCFTRLREDEAYRNAVVAADLAIADSGLMVLLSSLLRREQISRISGLKYLEYLLRKLRRQATGEIFWVLPNEHARRKLFEWSRRESFSIASKNCYVAPRYGLEIQERNLLSLLEQNRPLHVIIAIGSGTQEKLAYYLRENLSFRPAIHCTGAALGFVTGEQVAIPGWADRLFLGWLFRLFAQPGVFIPRLSHAFELPWLLWKYGERLPPLKVDVRERRLADRDW